MLSPTVIKLNNLLLYGSMGCVIPYLSTYFVHYTDSSSAELGKVMLVASSLGMICNLLSCSMADRFRAHHLVFTLAVLIAFVAFTSLLVPILYDTVYDSQAAHLAPIDPIIAVADLSAHLDDGGINSTIMTTTTTTAPSSIERQGNKQLAPAFERVLSMSFSVDDPTPEQHLPDNTWFYWISVAIIIGEMASTICMNLSDSMSANIALRCRRPFGTIRFWGAIGWVTSALILSFINTIRWVPFLAPAFCLYTALATLNILTLVFWPDKRPFDLAAKSEPPEEDEDMDSMSGDSKPRKQPLAARISTCKFKSAHKFPLMSYFKPKCVQDDLSLANVTSDKKSNVELTNRYPIAVVRFQRASSFDTRDEDVYRNIRRCSLAPLGEQHVIKQFELNKTSGKHFKFVTHIEAKSEKTPSIDYSFQEQDNESYLSFGGESHKSTEEPQRSIGFRVHFKIIQMIVLRNKLVLRFLFLFMVNGFTVNMNWLYLFPYLRSLDEMKFRSLSAYVLIGCNLSETLFYYTSPSFTRKFSAGVNLSIILFIYALRYSLYLIFALENKPVPLELIIIVELLQALNFSWFTCVLNESSLSFALGARNCVPDLIRMGLIDDSKESIEKVNNGVKVTMLSIASCCSDGFGVALGSLCGGWLIDRFGYKTLWLTSSSIAFTVALLNLMIEFITNRQPNNIISDKNLDDEKPDQRQVALPLSIR